MGSLISIKNPNWSLVYCACLGFCSFTHLKDNPYQAHGNDKQRTAARRVTSLLRSSNVIILCRSKMSICQVTYIHRSLDTGSLKFLSDWRTLPNKQIVSCINMPSEHVKYRHTKTKRNTFFFVWLLNSIMFPSCDSVTECFNQCLQIDGVSKLPTFFLNSKLKHRLLVLTGGNYCGFKDIWESLYIL